MNYTKIIILNGDGACIYWNSNKIGYLLDYSYS